MKKLTMAIFLMLVLSVSATQVYALSAIDITPNPTISRTGNYSLGWEFTANADIWVTALGFYDAGQDGLNTTHEVGIFGLDQSLLTQTTVGSGTSATLDGWFRYNLVDNALKLSAGLTYLIAAVTTGDSFTERPLSFTSQPQITYVGRAYANVTSSTVVFPSKIYSFNGSYYYFGPNFQFVTEDPNKVVDPPLNTPEPSTLILLGLGLVSVAVLGRKKLS